MLINFSILVYGPYNLPQPGYLSSSFYSHIFKYCFPLRKFMTIMKDWNRIAAISIGNPEYIRTLKSVDGLLAKINEFEEGKKCKAGVLMRQATRGPPVNYHILSEDKAKEALASPIDFAKSGFGLIYYPKAYYKALRDKILGKNGKALPEPVERDYSSV